jgi:hypothetical protein
MLLVLNLAGSICCIVAVCREDTFDPGPHVCIVQNAQFSLCGEFYGQLHQACSWESWKTVKPHYTYRILGLVRLAREVLEITSTDSPSGGITGTEDISRDKGLQILYRTHPSLVEGS